jgi:hypothetical protein
MFLIAWLEDLRGEPWCRDENLRDISNGWVGCGNLGRHLKA